MTKKNNRGFSLIEIVIAIAVLSLLLSPIIIQLVQSIRVNAQAKEKQYVVENAEYLLEYVQKTEIQFDEVARDIGKDGTVGTVGDPTINTVDCVVYGRDAASMNTIQYKVKSYTLEPQKLGRYQNEYQRNVSIDNLANKLLEKQYSVVYDGFTSNEVDNLTEKGFTFTNEGSCVKYDENGFVTAIVCENDTSLVDYVDPNTVNLGYVQDLDSSKVAILQGVATNPDADVTDAFYSLRMSHLKVLDYESWRQAMTGVTNDSIFDVGDFSDTLNKVTKISITSGPMAGEGVNAKPEYYEVSCDVYYSDSYTMYITGYDAGKLINNTTTTMTATSGGVSVTDILEYNVYSQRFYTTESPDVYFVYEPFIKSGIGMSTSYAPNDYITIYNDTYTESSKVYLVKPVNTVANPVADGTQGTSDMGSDGYVYNNVNIHINQIAEKGSLSTQENQTDIFTNLDLQAGGQTFTLSGITLSTLNRMNVLEADQELRAYGNDNLKSIAEDTREQGRLYTVTVTLERTDGQGDTVTFTGAKGAN